MSRQGDRRMQKIIKKFDIFFINLINKKMKTKTLDRFMYWITDRAGAIGVMKISLFLLVVGYFLSEILWRIGFQTLLSLGFGQAIIQIIKLLVKRQRPYQVMEGINTYGIEMRDYSFPSGHTAAAFTLATVMILNSWRFWYLGLILAIIIALSRIYLGLHYPSDVCFSIIFAILASLVVDSYLMTDLVNAIIKII